MRPNTTLLVTLLTTTLSPAAGGLAASVPALARGLAAQGLPVGVVGVADPARPEAAQDWGPEVHALSPRPPHAFHYAPGMGRVLAACAPAVVDVQGLWTWPSLVNLRHHRRHGTPYAVTPRGMLDPWARARSAWKKRLVQLWFEDAHLRGAACLRATAEMEADHFRSFGLRQAIAIVPNGVDTPPQPRPAPAPGAPRRLLFLSRLHPKKGLPLLLRAWAALAPERPDWELVIAGPDEVGHQAEMQRLARELALPRLRWHGPVQGAEKDALYRSAELFVLPTHAENFGLVVAEALAHGVPVITTRNAPWSELEPRDCGWWIDLAPARLLETLRQATARPPAELLAMGARGHAWMQADFAWTSVAQRMAQLYEWVRHGGPPPAFVHH